MRRETGLNQSRAARHNARPGNTTSPRGPGRGTIRLGREKNYCAERRMQHESTNRRISTDAARMGRERGRGVCVCCAGVDENLEGVVFNFGDYLHFWSAAATFGARIL